MRLAHLLTQRQHDVAMGRLDHKLLESGLSIPHGQGPKLPPEYPCQQRVAEQARCPPQLALDAPRVEQERRQIPKALQREFGQQDQIFPLRVWSTTR